MMPSRKPFALLLLLGALALGACSDLSGSRESRLTLKLTDAPGDLAEAWVEITEIYLQGSADDAGGRVSLFQGSTGMIDLLTLAGGKTVELVQGATVPAGTYAQLRFRIGKAFIRTEDRRTFSSEGGTLTCPSCASSSGLKVKLPGGSVRIDGDAEVLVVDFDVSQSFGRERGKSGRWVMHPVLTASDFRTSGAIAGSVTLAGGVSIPDCGGQSRDLASFVPTAAAGEILRSGGTAATGAYRITFVAPGSYTLGAARVEFENGDALEFTATATPASVQVASGATASADFQVTAVTCTPGA